MPLETSTTAEQTGGGIALGVEGVLFNSNWRVQGEANKSTERDA